MRLCDRLNLFVCMLERMQKKIPLTYIKFLQWVNLDQTDLILTVNLNRFCTQDFYKGISLFAFISNIGGVGPWRIHSQNALSIEFFSRDMRHLQLTDFCHHARKF